MTSSKPHTGLLHGSRSLVTRLSLGFSGVDPRETHKLARSQRCFVVPKCLNLKCWRALPGHREAFA
jgi:hypothetical protein